MLVAMSTVPGPAPGRRPQAERSQESRDRILDAAMTCLVEEGYAGTNTLTIQARAGMSRGRLLHQFPSRDELLVAAAHHVFDVQLAEPGVVEGLLPEVCGDLGARIDAVVELLWATFHQRAFWAATELWVAARTEPALADVVRPAERRLGRAIWARMDALFGPQLAGHPMYPVVRNVLFTSMRGVALTYSFDRRDAVAEPSIAGWQRLARTLLLGGGAAAEPRTV
jgi:AcrR family transcriptional regulator